MIQSYIASDIAEATENYPIIQAISHHGIRLSQEQLITFWDCSLPWNKELEFYSITPGKCNSWNPEVNVLMTLKQTFKDANFEVGREL